MLVEDKISHREVTNQTASTEGLILLMKLYLLSMATVAVELFYPVVVHLVGALSLYHLDSFYGATSNAARLERAGGWLEIDYRIPFRQCVVRDGQRLFVPLMWSNKNGPRLKVLELLPDGSGRYTEEFPTEWLYEETSSSAICRTWSCSAIKQTRSRRAMGSRGRTGRAWQRTT